MVYLVNLSERDYQRKKNKWLPKIFEWVKVRCGVRKPCGQSFGISESEARGCFRTSSGPRCMAGKAHAPAHGTAAKLRALPAGLPGGSGGSKHSLLGVSKGQSVH